MSAPGLSRVDLLLPMADDELVLGWRNSEWTGIAPFLEEDVAFSSIAQNEIGHARALYELVADELGTDADALALDRDWHEYRSCPLAELRLVPDWAKTIARHFLYETADSFRVRLLRELDDEPIAGLMARIDREETYHRMHAQMWIDRLVQSDAGRLRLDEALRELWPYALGVLEGEQRNEFARHVRERLPFELAPAEPVRRGRHVDELSDLVREMTDVRRLAPAGQW